MATNRRDARGHRRRAETSTTCRRLHRHAAAGLLGAALLVSGCGAVAGRAARSAGAELVGGLGAAVRRHPDPALVEDGMPFTLLLLDGLLETSPNDRQLLRAAAESYTIYTQAFLSDHETLSTPAGAERSVRLWARAKEYGLRLLKLRRPGFAAALDADFDTFEAALGEFTIDDVSDLHAGAHAWLGWIIAASDSMDALAELPRALALAERALALDETYGDGSTHLVFGVFYTVQPRGAGQDLERAKGHFERAIELAGPSRLLPVVMYAEYYGAATLDETFFRERLESVLEADVTTFPDDRFSNELARRRAESLLENAEEIF